MHLHPSIMPSCICISLSFFHVVCLFLSSCLVFIYLFFVFKIKKGKKKKNKKILCVLCTLVLVYLGLPLKQSFLNFVSFIA